MTIKIQKLMVLNSKKPKICKCGHDKEVHYKQPKTKLSIINECNRCKCSDYLKRDRPNNFDKSYLIIGFVVYGMLIFAAIAVFPLTDIKDEIKIPTSTFGVVLELLTILAGLILFQPYFGNYLDARRRKTHEIEP